MNDVMSLLETLHRPRLLMQAARHGARLYRRETQLPRLLCSPVLPGPRQAAIRLLCLEQDHEAARRSRAADYCAARHLEVLIALICEARAILAAAPVLPCSARSGGQVQKQRPARIAEA
ncbi:DUF6477 family protein [Mangrovicoccus algicola]|uniref:Uncharacterized protein n=1 Tax=Mangrovicoccus algicola TaxID=2771008 RepID=A0A8J7CHP2_9RHOB|nr:DUF6477 family protein [Mangrovicoccus algicola]MBE3638460.1 hypothetical protein [Mangrovicoccus algicola]